MLAAVALAIAPLAQSLGGPASADCVIQQDAPDQGCCGGASPGAVCVMGGSACMVSPLPGAAADVRSDVPVAAAPTLAGAQARAPDTAPPKAVSA